MGSEIEKSVSEDGYATPPEVLEAVNAISLQLLPAKSKEKYMAVYKNVMDWRKEKNLSSLSENVLLLYFDYQIKNFKPPTVWAHYSMLRSTLNMNNQVDISKYSKVVTLLKRHSEGYQPKKSKVFSSAQIEKFLTEAADDLFLATKVALIFGIKGACRGDELTKITVDDIENQGRLLLVNLRNTKTKIDRSFVIDGEFANIVKKYANLRPHNTNCNRFFLNFQNGKCTNQPIGKNKFSNMPTQIAEHLKIPDAHLYTGHSFRRTSATLLADSGASMETICQLGGWKSKTVAGGYVENSVMNKAKIGNQITSDINLSSTKSISELSGPSKKRKLETSINFDTSIQADCLMQKEELGEIKITDSAMTLQLNNCSNISIHFKE